MNKLRLFQKRQLINHIRDLFTVREFFELETPLLVPSPGMEVHLHGFRTNYQDFQGQSHSYYLPTSPEFSLKKALGNGYQQVFEIARVFRNQGELGSLHHPEFNLLEWYRPGSYEDIMADVEVLLHSLDQLDFLKESADFSWSSGVQRSSVQQCFQQYAQLDLTAGMQDLVSWRNQAAQVLQEQIPADDNFEDIFFRIWLKFIEPNLGLHRPEIVYDYPASMAALAQLKAPERQWAERFELYIKGIEIGNAFSELIDSDEQLQRFEAANHERDSLGYPPHPVDHDLVRAVGQMQATGGIAMGIERLLMVITGETDIRQCFFQPLGTESGAMKRT